MRHLVLLLLLLISTTSPSQAESKEEIMEILAQKLRIQSPDNDFADPETKAANTAFLKKHQPLVDSLGKDEIFYHLQLTTDLYSDRRPGFQPHAVYAVYLYSRFHDEYSPEEYETIAAKVRDFSEKGWLPKRNFDEFLAIQAHKELLARYPDDDAKLPRLLSGKKNPGDQQTIDSLGIASLDFLLTRFRAEESPSKLPIYARLIGSKYRQFSNELSPEKKTEILSPLCSRIGSLKDEGQSAYLMQASLRQLHGIDHPAVRGLMDARLQSENEATRKAAQSLKDSLDAPQ